MTDLTPPTPWRRDARGKPAYDAAEMKAYRKASGVTVDELAASLYVSTRWVTVNEDASRHPTLDVRNGDAVMAILHQRGGQRRRMVEDGLDELAIIRSDPDRELSSAAAPIRPRRLVGRAGVARQHRGS